MKSRHSLGFSLGMAFAFALHPASTRAETIVTQRINATRRLIPLKKITVGPDDQYSGSADLSGKSVVFTHKSDLVPHLCRQNLESGEVTDLLPLTADSQESSLGPDGRFAFTYYRFNARGDVCYAPLPGDPRKVVANDQIHCLKAGTGEAQSDRSNPFWRSGDELGYVLRDLSTQISQVVSENLSTGARQVLAQGKVWSPAMRAGGRYLFYSELSGSRERASRVLMLKDLTTGQTRPIRFALPGISGFPSVSEDEKYVYFSHYLDDTNGDNIIDGSDNSVVFRAPIQELLKTPETGEFFPEQLTSVENNCSFPRPFRDTVFVSCAFEGALDIYQIPRTGTVPADWVPAILSNAHQTSRTYAERILLLNTMKYRQHLDGPEMEERLLSDHLLADDTTAAMYYIARLQSPKTPNAFYTLLSLYLQGRERKKSQPSTEISREFLSQILAIDAQVQQIRGQPRFQSIVRGLLRSFVDQPREALSFFKQVHFDPPVRPLERYFGFELASWVLSRNRSETVTPMLDAYKQMAGAPELGEESQIYYAFNLLGYLQSVQGAGDPQALSRRIAAIRSFNHGMPQAVDDLLRSEIAALEVIQAPDEAAKAKAYIPLDQLMSTSRGDYYLRKALYVRAILNFTDGGEFRYMDYVASNWLRYTTSGDTEFIHAREFFAEAELDHAYESWGKKNYPFASNYFYGSLSLTDDLESHSGYLRSMILRGMRTSIDEQYKNLANRQFVEDNLKFVEAMLILIDAEPTASKNPESVQHLDQAIAKLSSMTQDRDSPVRYALLGYCYLEKLLRLSSGYEIDPELFQNANRNLMLAYDLGRGNDRIKAAVLMDLGILHQRAQNHGLAAKFFALRKPLGFITSDEAGAFAWLAARSLYYTHQPEKAAEELAHAPGNVSQGYVAPLLEREAFYRTAASQFDRAAELYADLLKSGRIVGEASLAKVNLNYGFALFKLNRSSEAQAALRASVAHAEKGVKIPKDRVRLIDSDPVRIRLAAYGLLSRVGTDAERLDANERRGALLPEAQKLFQDSYLPVVIENRLSRAAIASRLQPARSVASMKEGLQFAEELGESDQGYLSNAVFRAASEYLAHAWLHTDLYAREKTDRIKKVVEKCIHAYEGQKGVQPLLNYQKLKLQMLWAGFSAKQGNTRAQGASELHALASSDAVQGLKAGMPAQWKELQTLSVQLAR